MKKQLIRRGTFETNSSSSHTLTLDSNLTSFSKSVDIYPDKSGELTVIFDTEIEDGVTLTTFSGKIQYLIYELFTANNDRWEDSYVQKLKEGYRDTDEWKLLELVVFNNSKASKLTVDEESLLSAEVYGQEGISEGLFSSVKELEVYLYSTKSYINCSYDG